MAYPDDPTFAAEVLELYATTWPALPAAIGAARSWGADWYAVSTPFVVRELGRVVAHVGVIEMPLVIEGELRRVAGVHAVCTHPAHRGRGHARTALELALAHVDAHYETAVLWSEKLELYTRFGFQPRHERMFTTASPGSSAEGSARRLDLDSAEDRALLASLLHRRTPVSERLASADPGWHFSIDVAIWKAAREMLWFASGLEALIVADQTEDRVRIYDVVAPELPSLADLVAALGAGERGVELYFSPDRFAAAWASQASPLEDVLMVRGNWPLSEGAFALSPLCRC